ncbi:hypothetical protein ONZ43_g3858 [Nemania bipapillata]|uniref:Uncharacterized protein n=1 Tax=Nemania bipapillata TaxID=110536 RepID=A0ACC2IVE5_9PEZI|nr:hypothetical protein ONZ43_g3858 [Nemania bipapillata]
MSTSIRTSTSSGSPPQGTEAMYHDQAQGVDDANSASQEYDKHPHDQALAKKVSDAINKALDSAKRAASIAAPAAVTSAEAVLVRDLTSVAKLAAAAAAADAISKSILKVVAAEKAVEEARRNRSSSTASHTSPTPTSSDVSCKLPRAKPMMERKNHNTLRATVCGNNGKPTTTDYVITSVTYAAQPTALPITKTCKKRWSQACYHYSSVISNNPDWETLTCPQAAATTNYRPTLAATSTWGSQHNGNRELVDDAQNWMNPKYRQEQACARDEYPPAYLLDANNLAWKKSGVNTDGQLVRYISGTQNTGAGSMWKGICLKEPIKAISNDQDLLKEILKSTMTKGTPPNNKPHIEAFYVHIDVNHRPEFSITSWEQVVDPKDPDGLQANKCWPKDLAPHDPGFALLTYDQYYTQHGRTPEYDYSQPYVKGKNGPVNGP